MSGLLNEALLPFQLPFMQQAFVLAVAVAIPASLLSCFLVLKGWALMGDAISHAVLPGIVLAYILGAPLALGAFIAGIGCSVVTGFIGDNSRLREDTVMGIVFSGMFAAGLVMFTAIRTDVHLDHILFGDLLGTTWRDVLQSIALALIITGAIAFTWKDLLLQAFDETQARAIGQRVTLYHYGLLTLVSLTVVAALQAVGLILAIAFLITPGAIAYLVTKRASAMLIIAVVVGVSCALISVYASFFLNSAPAPTIVVVMSAMFLAAFFYSQKTRKADGETNGVAT